MWRVNQNPRKTQCLLEQTWVKVIFSSSFFFFCTWHIPVTYEHLIITFFFNLCKRGILFISRLNNTGFCISAGHWYRAAAERGSAATPETRSASYQLSVWKPPWPSAARCGPVSHRAAQQKAKRHSSCRPGRSYRTMRCWTNGPRNFIFLQQESSVWPCLLCISLLLLCGTVICFLLTFYQCYSHELKAGILNFCFMFIFWSKTQMSSVYNNNKGPCRCNTSGGDCIYVCVCVDSSTSRPARLAWFCWAAEPACLVFPCAWWSRSWASRSFPAWSESFSLI